MVIHTVQQGDTVNSIAEQYNIPSARLIRDNDLPSSGTLNIGQNLIISYPERTYTVQNGDTAQGVAEAFGIPALQFLRNNPQLADNATLTPGEELVISYNNKDKKIKVNGFANSFLNMQILRRTLPYLTYITILNYRITEDGDIVDIRDEDIIQMAKEYGVAPLMFLSALNEYGEGGYGVIHSLMTNQDLQNNVIQKTMGILKTKGFYGLYLGFQHFLQDDLPLYVNFINSITKLMNKEGFEVFVSLIPETFGFKPGVQLTVPYYQQIGEAVNYATLITYQWTTSFISQYNETTPGFLKLYLDYVVTQIPPEKLFLGLSRIAYDWELPYVEGETPVSFLTNAGAVSLAYQVNATILHDEATQTPYFNYNSLAGVQHFVWFKDAKSIDAVMNLVTSYGLEGVAVWNIMYYYSPTFVIINSQYDIESVLNRSPGTPS